jgi:hypothetical protein
MPDVSAFLAQLRDRGLAIERVEAGPGEAQDA